MGSRAACISRRSLEICGRLGALPEMMERGLPWSGGRSFWQDTEVFRFSMPLYEGQRLPPMINLQQYYIEDALLGAVARANAQVSGLIDLRWATTVDAIEPHGLGVIAEPGQRAWPRHADRPIGWWPATAARASCATRWAWRWRARPTPAATSSSTSSCASTHPTERRAWFDPPWHRGATVLMHRQPDDLWRIDWQLRHGDNTDEAMSRRTCGPSSSATLTPSAKATCPGSRPGARSTAPAR